MRLRGWSVPPAAARIVWIFRAPPNRETSTVTHWQLSISWSVWRSWGFNPELFDYFAFDLWILAFGIFVPANFRILSNFLPLKKN